jgi:pyrroline-5-carboxylate reductase
MSIAKPQAALCFCFWGGGQMAEACISGLSKSGVSLSKIRVIELNNDRRKYLRETFGNEIILFRELVDDLFRGVVRLPCFAKKRKKFIFLLFKDVIVLALKPQVALKALRAQKVSFLPTQVILSIMAGLSMETVSSLLNHNAVVRCMPNTPAQVFKGVSVYCHTPAVTSDMLAKVQKLLTSLGDCVIHVDDESYLDKATGVSGSGPGFVFVIFEAFMDTAVELGFSRAQAQAMTLQLFDGCVTLARSAPGQHVAQLKNSVTSPGGTTAAGIAALEQNGLRNAVRAAIIAATTKSEQLGLKASAKL